MNRYVPVEKCNEIAKQNTDALRLTRLCRAQDICGLCWARCIKKLETIVEVSEVFEYLPEKVKKTLAVPRYTFILCENCKNQI